MIAVFTMRSGIIMADEVSLVARWRAGDQQAAAELFRRYANRLIALARSRLPAKLVHRVDPEDVVQSVYRSFYAGAREDRYDLQRGGDLWRLLVTITLHKVYYQVRRNAAGKRAVDLEQSFGSEDSLLGIQPRMLAREPSPVEALALAESLTQVMGQLQPLHRRMLELRLLGNDVEAIAAATDRTQRTVRRVLDEVKQRLEEAWQSA
jgi:RNA polymerase sigma-70 factor (ECF subfamily)